MKEHLGKYCLSCQKEVKDFCNFSASELQEWFSQHAKDQSCGRFTKKQLMLVQSDHFKSNFWAHLKANIFIASLLALPMITKASAGGASDKAAIEISPFWNLKKEANDSKINSLRSDTTRKLKGIVFDSDEKIPLVAATVKIKGTNKQAVTDRDGNFEIDLSGLETSADQFLIVRSIGFETLEQKLDLPSIKPLRIMLNGIIVGEMCIKRPSIFRRFINAFRKL